jgi:Undecaprenyl-phosphate glucose phosphotransferase
VFPVVFHLVGVYRTNKIHFGFQALKKIIQGCVFGVLVLFSMLYLISEKDISRIFLVLFLVTLIISLLVERFFLQFLWKKLEKSFVLPLRALLVGQSDILEMYHQKIEYRKPYPINWLGRLGSFDKDQPFLESVKYLGEESELLNRVRNLRPQIVIVSYDNEQSFKYSEILQTLSQELIEVKILPDYGKYSTFTYSASDECGVPFLVFNQNPMSVSNRVTKRILDVCGSLGFILVTSPIFLLVSLLIKLTSRGPIIYRQERVGADGKVFTLYKFRSMHTGAEDATGAVWASPLDERTTPLGKWLRKTSIDEFPQFFNVLKGDMSLVGPRPERPVFVEQFRSEVPKYMLRHQLKSGITGWAQVNGWRGNTSIEKRIKHDLFYIGHWSHFFDFKILCLTLVKGFIHKNAY